MTALRAPTWVRYPDPAILETTLPVRLVPPSIEVMSIAVHAAQGGSEAVVYRVGETAVRDGVHATADPEALDDLVIQAAQVVSLDEFLEALPSTD